MTATQAAPLKSLLEEARKHVRQSNEGRLYLRQLDMPIKPDEFHSQHFSSVVDRVTKVDEQSHDQILEYTLAAEAYLRYCQVDMSIPENHIAATQLQDWTIRVISSADAFAPEAPYAAETKPVFSPEDLARIRFMKATGLHLLSRLQELQVPRPDSLAAHIACLAAYTDLQDTWTNEEAHDLAQSMLSKHVESIQGDPKKFGNPIADLLLDHVKPLFLKSKPSILTDQGRKAMAPLPGNAVPSDLESGNKPWKFQSPHIITIFQWVLQQLDIAMVEEHWPLIIPPLLTILDDVSIPYKIRGCQLLKLLLKVAPASLLERSGLGEVFHDTLMPYLLFLPSLTPEEESIPILNATYDTLLSLTSVQYGIPQSRPSKIKTLDAIFRYGILKGYTHAGEKVRIAEVLLKKSTDLVNAMGIYSVKHLKDLLPIISTTLIAPFATAYPPLLHAAVQLLRAMIVNGWPRLAFHRVEILEGLVICWCRIQDEDKPTTALLAVKRNIEDVLRVVVQLLSSDEEMQKDLQMLRETDSRLETILKVEMH
ncbi:MAG: hypothetical protein Q9209_007917 [Squamulea sp. 1 TL-2023]